MIKPPGTMFLNKTDCPSLSGPQLPAAPQLVMGAHVPLVHQCWNVDWLHLVRTLCRDSQKPQGPFMCRTHHFTPGLPDLWFLDLFFPFFHSGPWAFRGGVWYKNCHSYGYQLRILTTTLDAKNGTERKTLPQYAKQEVNSWTHFVIPQRYTARGITYIHSLDK